jgi:large subunit ribosomal protein L13
VRTYSPKASEITRKWHVVDADGLVLGRLATEVARVLRGKHKPVFAPHIDTGDHVIVINAAKVHLTGRKEQAKLYRHHTLYLGGLKSETVEERRKKHPTRIVEEAIRGMLPKTRLGRAMFHKLKVYAGDAHPHQAQKPQVEKLKRQERAR